MASNYDGNKGVNGNGLLYFIGKVKTWIDTYFLKKNLGSSKASKVVVTDSSGNVDVSTISSTELGYLSGMNQNIKTALGNKASLSDLSSLGSAFNTFVNTTAPATYQKKMTIGGGTEGAVTKVRANGNFIITISQDGKTAAFSVPEADSSTKGVVAVGLGKLSGVDEEDGYFDCFGVDEMDGYKLKAPAVNTTKAGVMTPYMYNKLAGIEAEANKYVLPQATASILGGAKVFSDTAQSVAANAVSSTAGRTYGVQKNSSGQLVVNVPWEDTKFTLQPMDFQVFGGAYLGQGLWMDDDHLSVKVKDGGNLEVVYDSESGLSELAIVSSPALKGTPTAPTAATSTNTTQIATTAFVHAAIENADIGGKTYQGNIDAENSATGKRALKDIKTFKQGQYFTVSSAFTFADGSWALGIGDMLFVKENYTWASGNVDGSKFAAVQGNNDYLTNSELDAIFTEVFGSAA